MGAYAPESQDRRTLPLAGRRGLPIMDRVVLETVGQSETGLQILHRGRDCKVRKGGCRLPQRWCLFECQRKEEAVSVADGHGQHSQTR